jgi:hypothetical protein
MLHLVMPFLAFIINWFTQILGCRYLKRLSLLKSVFCGYGIGLVCLLTGELFFWLKEVYALSEFLALVSTNCIIYSVFGYWYFIFITLLETAIRTRLVMQLNSSKGGLSESEMLMKYNSQELIEKRINRLVRNGQILKNGNKFYSGKSSLMIYSKFSEMMHQMVPGEKREA